MAMTADENSDSESDTEEPPFKKITINTNYKIKTSLKEPPTKPELKPLSDNLEYVFLEEPSFLHVIISSELSKEKQNKLISLKICSLKLINSSSLPISLFSKWKKTVKFSLSYEDLFLHTVDAIDVIDEILEENFDALLDEGSKILHSIEETILEEKLFAKFDEFMAMTINENSESESDTEEPPFEKITFNTDYKIKTSLEKPPTDLELKPLHDNLECVFLE
nr:hypothetical protein [Tanacetum cinerariifolium]